MTLLCFPRAGWHRGSSQGGSGRRQRPQSPQHPGCHHRESPGFTQSRLDSTPLSAEASSPQWRGAGLGREVNPSRSRVCVGAALTVCLRRAGHLLMAFSCLLKDYFSDWEIYACGLRCKRHNVMSGNASSHPLGPKAPS